MIAILNWDKNTLQDIKRSNKNNKELYYDELISESKNKTKPQRKIKKINR
jgi:hypothetical protein